MNDSTKLLLIEGSEETIAELRSVIEAIPEAQYRVSKRENLDGETANWVIILPPIIEAIKAALNYVAAQTGPKLPTKIKYGDIEIDHPTEEMVAIFQDQLADLLRR